MIIGIFGDSFAATRNMPFTPEDHVGWTRLIEQAGFSVNNYALGGSGLYYSWDQFHQNQQSCDRVIFLVTQWDRHFIEWWEDPSAKHDWIRHQNSYSELEEKIKTLKTRDDLRQYPLLVPMLEALKAYWTYIDNFEQRTSHQRLMLEDIQRTRPDALIMSGFDPHQSRYQTPLQADLNHASMIDVRHYFGKDWARWSETYRCRRHNHLNRINNQILADAVIKWLHTHDVNEVCDLPWEVDTEKPWEYYFKKIK